MSHMEDAIATLAADAARRPEKVGLYLDFLLVGNRAAREATETQRAKIRRLTDRRLLPEQYAVEIKKIMGWD